MSKKRVFERLSDEQQQQYEREARLQYGPDVVNASIKRWNSYSREQQDAIMQEGGQNYLDMAEAMEAGKPVEDAEVQAIVERWGNHLRYFYEPTLDIMRGLGEMYQADPAFAAFFEKIHPDLPEYLSRAIARYVDDLEYAELERMIAEDEARRLNE